jgi:biopolymer transport protein ExbB
MNKYVLTAMTVLWFALPLAAQERPDIVQQPNATQSGPVSSQITDDLETAASQAPAIGPVATSAAAVDTRPLSDARSVIRDFSPWSMFLSADALVKAVMISLVFASFLTWTIFLARSVKLNFAQWQLKKALARTSTAKTLAEAQLAMGRRHNVLSNLLAAATQEIQNSPREQGIKERVSSTFSEILRTEARAARQGLGLIATIGSTAPFVGLFGTVWGIMNSFIGISKSQTTNLAVVAPGIAEALLATAFGLAAAIPAVIIYNHLIRNTKGYLDLVGSASGAVGRLVSRDLDRPQRATSPHAVVGRLVSRDLDRSAS